ncbi:MAG: glycosyltransferase family 1 protein [Candidatus Binatus sp.]
MLQENSQVFINMRSQTAGLRGVQRYTAEVQRRLADRVMTVTPGRPMQGIRGHLWEQAILPTIVGKRLLWSPANTGPLRIENQVLTIHDIASIEHPEWFQPAFAKWYQWLTPELIKRVRRVITVSKFSRQRLLALANIEESKVVVIYGGVDERFRPSDAEEAVRIKNELGIPSAHYILSLGALEPRKNLRRLLEAWSLCATRLPDDVWLVVAGSSVPTNVFGSLDLGAIPPRVHFAGFVADENLPGLYSAALAMVYVSLYEGFGLPVLEAMASGTVPIVANNTSLPEVVRDGGIQVDPYEVEDIAVAIERVVNDSGFRKGLEARAIQQSRRFSWDFTSQLTWKVLSEAIAS